MDNQVPMVGLDNSSDVIKVRCPSCYKLYGVDKTEIRETKPQFQCIKCQTRFWFSFHEGLGTDEILGFPVEWLTPSTEDQSPSTPSPAVPPPVVQVPQVEVRARTFNCPRCQAPYASGDKECPKCGVVFAKLEFVEDAPSVQASPTLRKLWRQVMDNYTAPAIHQKFLHVAQKENNLLFASHQYGRLLKAHSGDEVALQMQKEIVALTEVQAGLSRSQTAPRRSRSYMPRLSTMALLCGGIMIGVGVVLPAMRNLIGLGAAAVFFTMAVEFIVKRNP